MMRPAAWIALAFILGLGLAYATRRPPAPRAVVQEKPEPCDGAQFAAENFVRPRLKAPSTARFDRSWERQVVPLPNGKCLVTGWVDAQNSFGAMLRVEWRVVMLDLGDRFRLDILRIGDEIYAP